MESYKNHKWFEITDEAKNQIEKLLAKNPGKYAVLIRKAINFQERKFMVSDQEISQNA